MVGLHREIARTSKLIHSGCIVYYYKDQSVPMGLKSIKKNADVESVTVCTTQVRRSKGAWDRLYLLEMAGKGRRTKFKSKAKI